MRSNSSRKQKVPNGRAQDSLVITTDSVVDRFCNVAMEIPSKRRADIACFLMRKLDGTRSSGIRIRNRSDQTLIRAIQECSVRKQDEIVRRLIESFDPPISDEEKISPEELEALWLKEIKRRIKAVEEGRMKLIPIEEVFRKTKARYKLRQCAKCY